MERRIRFRQTYSRIHSRSARYSSASSCGLEVSSLCVTNLPGNNTPPSPLSPSSPTLTTHYGIQQRFQPGQTACACRARAGACSAQEIMWCAPLTWPRLRRCSPSRRARHAHPARGPTTTSLRLQSRPLSSNPTALKSVTAAVPPATTLALYQALTTIATTHAMILESVPLEAHLLQTTAMALHRRAITIGRQLHRGRHLHLRRPGTGTTGMRCGDFLEQWIEMAAEP